MDVPRRPRHDVLTMRVKPELFHLLLLAMASCAAARGPAGVPRPTAAPATEPAMADERSLRLPDVVDALAFSQDGRLLAAGCRDKFVYVLDVRTLKTVTRFEHGEFACEWLKFSADGTVLACRTWNGLFVGNKVAHAWRLKDGKQLVPRPDKQPPRRADKEPVDRPAAAGGKADDEDPRRALLDAFAKAAAEDPGRWAGECDLSADGTTLALCEGFLEGVALVDLTTGRIAHHPGAGRIDRVGFSPDARRLIAVTASLADPLEVQFTPFVLPEFKPLAPYTTKGGVLISPAGGWVAIHDAPSEDAEAGKARAEDAAQRGRVRILALGTGKEQTAFRTEAEEIDRSECCFSADGLRLVTADESLRVRDTANGRLTASRTLGDRRGARIDSIAAAPAAASVALSFNDRTVVVFNLSDSPEPMKRR